MQRMAFHQTIRALSLPFQSWETFRHGLHPDGDCGGCLRPRQPFGRRPCHLLRRETVLFKAKIHRQWHGLDLPRINHFLTTSLSHRQVKSLWSLLTCKVIDRVTSCYPRSSTETWGYRSETPLILKLRPYYICQGAICYVSLNG